MIRLKSWSRRGIAFALRQTHNFKLIMVRRLLHSVAMRLSNQYDSIYATALGADPIQLGSLRSVGGAVGALASLPAGWLIDTYSLKKVFLIGTVLLGLSSTLYLVAPSWTYLYAALILYYVGARVICTSCTVTCAGELGNENRATGRGLCRTVSSVLALVTPFLAAWFVSLSGGMNVKGLRPLYGIQVGVFVLTFILLARWFRDPAISRASQSSRPSLTEIGSVLGQGPDVVRLMLVIALMEIPWAITTPYMPLFAHQVKDADEFVLGGITTAMSLVPLILSIPLGRLADRYGRKRLLFAMAPAAYAAHLCLILAPNQGVLLVAGVLFGFDSISTAIVAAMAAEIMPRNQMGRWIGIVSLVRGLASIPAPLIGGLIWDHVGPSYVFVAAIALDVVLRLPLLASVRETLHLDIQTDWDPPGEGGQPKADSR